MTLGIPQSSSKWAQVHNNATRRRKTHDRSPTVRKLFLCLRREVERASEGPCHATFPIKHSSCRISPRKGRESLDFVLRDFLSTRVNLGRIVAKWRAGEIFLRCGCMDFLQGWWEFRWRLSGWDPVRLMGWMVNWIIFVLKWEDCWNYDIRSEFVEWMYFELEN